LWPTIRVTSNWQNVWDSWTFSILWSYNTCSIKVHFALVSWVLMIKNQIATLIFWLLLFFCFITINSQIYMENMSSCAICKLKIFLMVSWESNLDHVYYLHFCPNMSQKVGTPWTPNSKMGKPFGNVGIHFLTLVEVCLSLMIFSQPTFIVMF